MRRTQCVSDFLWADVADEVCIGDFPILSFVVKNIVHVPSMRSAFGLVNPMPVQSLPNSFSRERVQVGPSGPATSLLIFPCFPEPSVKF